MKAERRKEEERNVSTYTWIVCLECNDQITTGRHHGHITSGGIHQCQGIGHRGIEITVAGG